MLFRNTYIETTVNTTLPAEGHNSLVNGLLAHFGPTVGFCILVEMHACDPIWILFSFISVSILGVFHMLYAEKKAPCIDLDGPKKSDILEGLGFVFLKGFGFGGIIVALSWLFFQPFFSRPSSDTWGLIWLTVAASDFAYYFIHRFLNHGRKMGKGFRWFRRNHATHHAVKALDFLRGNHSSLIDTAVCSFQIPVAFIGSCLGLNLTQVIVAYILLLLLQSTHHVNCTFNIGWFRFIFVDNHNHKLHHCPRGYLVNFGAVFSLWDSAH